MPLLAILTLIYVAVLVLVLAVSLITILTYLYRINSVLGEAETALAAVQRHSKPLENQMEHLKESVSGAAHALTTAAEEFKA
jgi:cell division protein FtsL